MALGIALLQLRHIAAGEEEKAKMIAQYVVYEVLLGLAAHGRAIGDWLKR
jgi:hypothetical protein